MATNQELTKHFEDDEVEYAHLDFLLKYRHSTMLIGMAKPKPNPMPVAIETMISLITNIPLLFQFF